MERLNGTWRLQSIFIETVGLMLLASTLSSPRRKRREHSYTLQTSLLGAPCEEAARQVCGSHGEERRPPPHLCKRARQTPRSVYPNAHPSGTPHEAHGEATSKRAINHAKEILSFARNLIARKSVEKEA